MSGQTQQKLRRRAERAISELLVAEIFLVQATIEGANALGDGFDEARRAFDENRDLGQVLKDTRQAVVQPFRERYDFFRRMRGAG
jgi:hypothetical protein